jgi:hypothetical protein
MANPVRFARILREKGSDVLNVEADYTLELVY